MTPGRNASAPAFLLTLGDVMAFGADPNRRVVKTFDSSDRPGQKSAKVVMACGCGNCLVGVGTITFPLCVFLLAIR